MREMTDLTLSCDACGWQGEPSLQRWACPSCAGPLGWSGPERFDRSMIREHEGSLWRYGAALPVGEEPRVSIGEPVTPLAHATLDGAPVRMKLDMLMPTGSYKDRGATVLLTHLAGLGATEAIEDSSGNAAAAIAGYAARAGIPCTVFAPAAASPGKLVQAAAFGARVERVSGSRDDVAQAAVDAAAAHPTATYASHNWHPFFIAGVMTWALETWEQLGYRAPDNVVVPVGAGSLLLGAERAFRMLLAGGEIARMPRFFASQPAACAPVVAAWEAGAEVTTTFDRKPTLAEGTAIANPIRGRALLRAVRDSNGGAVAVSEDEIVDALRHVAAQGIYPEPTSAGAVAGARALLRSGAIGPGETTVVVISGNGLKATPAIAEALGI